MNIQSAGPVLGTRSGTHVHFDDGLEYIRLYRINSSVTLDMKVRSDCKYLRGLTRIGCVSCVSCMHNGGSLAV